MKAKPNLLAALTTATAAMLSRFRGKPDPTPKPAHQREAKPNYTLKISGGDWQPKVPALPILNEGSLRVDAINWRFRNQRQDRKNRRRRWAAGDRFAFAR